MARDYACRANWRPRYAAVRHWIASLGLTWDEAYVGDVDRGYGHTHLVVRARTFVLKAQYRDVVRHVVLLAPAVSRVELTPTRKGLGAEALWIAKRQDAERLTGTDLTCVTPIVAVCRLPVIIDSRLRAHREIFVPSGRPSHAIRLPTAALALPDGVTVLDTAHSTTDVWHPQELHVWMHRCGDGALKAS